MNEATKWVLEYSRTKGMARLTILCIAAHAEGCVAVVPVQHLVQKGGVPKRQIYKYLTKMEKLGEVERIHDVTIENSHPFHFTFRVPTLEGMKGLGQCEQLADFIGRYRAGAKEGNIKTTQLRLLDIRQSVLTPTITDDELWWRSDLLRRQLGLPLGQRLPPLFGGKDENY
jgi:hypothetical protein